MKLKSAFFTLVLLAALVLPVGVQADAYPEVIQLPTGWRAEGIAVAFGHWFYSGSLATGAVYRGDLRTGEGEILVPDQGRLAVGLKVDERSGFLFVAGGPSGTAAVYDARTGETVEVYQLTGDASFINDVIITNDAAYFTNSLAPVIYVLPLGPGGALPDPSEVETLSLSGDYAQVAGFNVNGIEATSNGKYLIIVQSSTGFLFLVDADTGAATRIDLGGELVTAGDGIVLRGHTLYVVRNQLNLVAVIDLSSNNLTGVVVDELTSDFYSVPTTAAIFGNALYTVNARFGQPNPQDLPYEVVRVELNK